MRFSIAQTEFTLRGILCWVALFCVASHARAQVASDIEYHWQLYKINADGTGLARIAEVPGYECGSPKWSPDGTMIAYDTRPYDTQFGDSQIAVIPADGSRPPRLIGPGGMPSWSPDGTHLVFHTYGTPQQIVVMKADGSGREALANHWGSPRWLPDGNRIALIMLTGGIGTFDLRDGHERVMVTTANSMRPGFAVSPDGLSVVYGLSSGLYLARLDTFSMYQSLRGAEQAANARNPIWAPSVRTLLQSGTCYHASWSPDSKRFVFGWRQSPPGLSIEEGNLHQLWLFDSDAKRTPTPLAGQDTARHNTNPDWSPDGKTIIFASQKPLPTP